MEENKEPQENAVAVSEDIKPTQETDIGNSSVITQKETEFKPTSLMIEWLEVGFKIGSPNPTKISRALPDGNRETIYKWMKVPGFTKWWNDQWMEYWEASKSRLIEIGLTKAKDNHYWWRDMMEFFKYRKPVNENENSPQNIFNIMGQAVQQGQKDRDVTQEEKNEPAV